MLNLDKIMVAFDLSDYSVKAFKYGCELAAAFTFAFSLALSPAGSHAAFTLRTTIGFGQQFLINVHH